MEKATLENIEKKIDRLISDFQNFRLQASVDIATLKVKAGVWGLIGGLLPAVGTLILYVLKK